MYHLVKTKLVSTKGYSLGARTGPRLLKIYQVISTQFVILWVAQMPCLSHILAMCNSNFKSLFHVYQVVHRISSHVWNIKSQYLIKQTQKHLGPN